MKAYTYLVTHSPSGKMYYGSRKSETFDLFKTYFTSSKLIKRLIKEDGIQSFKYELRRSFNSYESARKWETKFLTKIHCVTNTKFYNQAISAPRICSKDSISEQERRKNISLKMKELWQTESYSSQFIDASKPHSKYRPRKKRTGIKLGPAIIERNGEIKQVKRNFVPAYVKCGWKRIGTPVRT